MNLLPQPFQSLGSAPIGTLIPPMCVLPLGFTPTSLPVPYVLS